MEIFSSPENKRKAILVGLIILIIITTIIYFCAPVIQFLLNIPETKEIILSYGLYGPLIMTGLVAIVLLFGFISQIPLIVAGGYAFGPFHSMLYTLIGFTIGGTIAFFIARIFGRPFIKKIISKEALEKMELIPTENIRTTLFVLYLIPLFPDALCYISGLTNLKYKTYLLVSTIPRIPMVILFAIAGHSFTNASLISVIIILLVIIILISLIIKFKTRIEGHVTKQINRMDKQK